jgi:hypothetical protein
MNKIKYELNYDNDETISFKYFIFISLFLLFIIIIKYLFSKEDIIIEIEKIKNMSLSLSEKITFFTKINTQINRDYLDDSKYYNEKGLNQIFGLNNSKNLFNVDKVKNANKNVKKVKFSDDIIYDIE